MASRTPSDHQRGAWEPVRGWKAPECGRGAPARRGGRGGGGVAELPSRSLEAHLTKSIVSSSSSSKSYDSQDVRNLICERREARNLYSEATREVGRLALCLDTVKIALSTSKEETNIARMRADEAHVRVAGKISLKSLCFYICDFNR